jgi:altronate hydrolase
MTSQKQQFLRLNAQDNIVVAIMTAEKNTPTNEGIATTERIGKGHKMAAHAIAAGEPVRKFGQIIGFAKQNIAAGAWVHEHNIGMGELSHDYAFTQGATQTDILPLEKQATFQGYRRANGKIGTRNYIGIMTSVNCSATVAGFIADEINRSGILKDYKNIDGVLIS